MGKEISLHPQNEENKAGYHMGIQTTSLLFFRFKRVWRTSTELDRSLPCGIEAV